MSTGNENPSSFDGRTATERVQAGPTAKMSPMQSIGGIVGICVTIFVLAYWVMPDGVGNSAIEFALLTVIAAGVWTVAGLLYQRL